MCLLILFILQGQGTLPTQFIAVENIKPGMKGYGLTVFQGTKIDTFNVEVVDVMKQGTPKGDVILVKVSGEYVNKTGIISGMSGSPIYLNKDTARCVPTTDKLIGALAYSYAIFPIEHYGGVTPIAEMLNPSGRSGDLPLPGGREGFSRIKIPFNFPDCDDEQILDGINKKFPSFRVVKVQTGTGHQNDSILPAPGSSLTIPLVIGDVNWSAIGTCTYREGNKIWGFGHPFAGLGKVELPFSTGYVYSTIPSTYNSYKLGTSTKIVGTIKNDNSTSISGTIGELPPLIELNLTVNSQHFHYQIVKEKFLLAFLFPSVILTSIAKQCKETGEVTIETSLNVSGNTCHSERSEESQYENFTYKNISTGVINKVVKDISQVFNYIQDNPFQKIDIEKVSMNLTISDTVKFAKIEELWVDKEKVKPGEEITMQIVLSTYKGGIAKERISFTLPQWLKKSKLTILVKSGELVRNKTLGQVKTFNEFTKWLQESPLNNELVIYLVQEGTSKSILGEDFKSLPPSFSSLFKETEKEAEIMKKRITTKWVVSGEKTVNMEVE